MGIKNFQMPPLLRGIPPPSASPLIKGDPPAFGFPPYQGGLGGIEPKIHFKFNYNQLLTLKLISL
ncbi:hypothetical protein B1L04_08100 [Microcystis aeruginosa KW]|uniref:Uncharacterized protein n=1 Tax=Microcystis aeruginosa KW TaxID=1960155 RepID=A0A1V4BXS5_MICAE|nr:hypothetical protein B1L04_08100 [Microcystis aeruginosa KW]